KRYNYNIKLTKLKSQKIEYERLWNHLTNKISTIQKPKLNSNILVSIDYTKRSIEELDNEILIMNKRLEEQILDVGEENEIIEELRELEKNKQIKITKLAELEQRQAKNLQDSEYYKIQERIETLENNLKKVYENLIKLSYKRLMTHRKMLILYRKVREFENIKKEIVNELIENKTMVEEYHQLFLKLMNQNKKMLLNKLSNRPKIKGRPREIKTPNVEAIIKKKKKYKKQEQKKLAIALDKQKAGKKLDFYELQLILKHSKDKKL
ncbi:MAG: hypothetical protein ACFFDH_16365, partial [Promethearchaeota archaeon]